MHSRAPNATKEKGTASHKEGFIAPLADQLSSYALFGGRAPVRTLLDACPMAAGRQAAPSRASAHALADVGEACSTPKDCQTGLCSEGKCAARALEGRPCTGADDCDLGLGLRCNAKNTCESITIAGGGEACTAGQAIVAGSTLCSQFSGCTDGRCRPAHRLGDACGPHDFCGLGIGCRGGVCSLFRPESCEIGP